jgi:hypothetical protein
MTEPVIDVLGFPVIDDCEDFLLFLDLPEFNPHEYLATLIKLHPLLFTIQFWRALLDIDPDIFNVSELSEHYAAAAGLDENEEEEISLWRLVELRYGGQMMYFLPTDNGNYAVHFGWRNSLPPNCMFPSPVPKPEIPDFDEEHSDDEYSDDEYSDEEEW